MPQIINSWRKGRLMVKKSSSHEWHPEVWCAKSLCQVSEQNNFQGEGTSDASPGPAPCFYRWWVCKNNIHLLSHGFCGFFSLGMATSSAGLQSVYWSWLASQLGKDLLPGSRGCWHHSVPCGQLDWGPQLFVGSHPETSSVTTPTVRFSFHV